ncbi:MAG: phage holin family protein [Rikenellaceae bacterium]|nr:phage holin family protein [Rikenellaceae bacterium]
MLFIRSIIGGDHQALMSSLLLVLTMWLIVLAAIIIDLMSGIYKARITGVTRTSFGFRRTVSKLIQYYSVMLFALMFDIIASLVVGLPYFTMLASAFLVFIEAKSVYEKAGDKLRRNTAENLADLIKLLENRDDLVKGIAEIIKSRSFEEDTGCNTK